VSTEEQRTDNQLMRLREACKARGWEIAGEYTDVISGVKQSRPALDRLMQDARAGKFNTVMVTKIDRLGRSLIHFLQITHEFERMGVDIVAIDQPIDTGGPTGKLIWAILGAVAEFERELIRERTREGLERARREGKRVGRKPIPEDVKRRAVELRMEGLSYGEVARMLGISKRSVIRACQNAGLTGAKTPPFSEEGPAIGKQG